jgi:hypothetical protein
MTTTSTIEVFQKAAELGLKLGFEPPDTLTVQPARLCSAEFAEALKAHKAALLALLKLPFVMVYSKALEETVFFAEDEATKAALIEAGASEWSIYTRAELRVLVAQNRVAPLSDAELRKVHEIKRAFNGTIVS